MHDDRFGFSTGALEKGDYQTALRWMRKHHIGSVELSALRLDELEPLVEDLDQLSTSDFAYVSFHAPSSFSSASEGHVICLLETVFKKGWNIVVHPDVIYTPSRWRRFGEQLLIENMDRRKETGRTVLELRRLLDVLPKARLCLDVAHARQLDTTLTLLWSITSYFKNRIGEVHMSELDSRCRHRPLSRQAILDYRHFASVLQRVPIIIESMMGHDHSELRQDEVRLARAAMEENESNW